MTDVTRARELAAQFRSHPVSRSIEQIEEGGELLYALAADLERVTAELERAREDARRWEFVRASKAGTIRLDGDHAKAGDLRYAFPEYIHWNGNLDAAIDAAIAKEEGHAR